MTDPKIEPWMSAAAEEYFRIIADSDNYQFLVAELTRIIARHFAGRGGCDCGELRRMVRELRKLVKRDALHWCRYCTASRIDSHTDNCSADKILRETEGV